MTASQIQNSIRLLRVFIGTPGDLGTERQRAHEAVESVNRSVGRFVGTRIELIGWEDTLPGAGRPQALINRDVDQCDVFLGALWKRWGTPPGGDDTYTSGFEEEFQRAMKRYRATGNPKIWLAFKRVDDESRGDPGYHLQKVLAFRESQEAAREVLFKEFLDADDWERKLREWLIAHVLEDGLRVSTPADHSEQSTAVVVPSTPAVPSNEKGDQVEEQLPAQVAALASLLQRATESGASEFLSVMSDADEFTAIRLTLVARALLSSRYTFELLTTHELNTLHRHRHALKFAPLEDVLVFRSVVADSGDVSPGWSYFADIDVASLAAHLFYYVQYDSLAVVRVGALKLLELASVGPATSAHRDAIAAAISSDDNAVSQAAIKYVGNVGQVDDAALLDTLLEQDGLSTQLQLQVARARILLREDANAAMSAISAQLTVVSADLLEAIHAISSLISDGVLRNALVHADRSLRKLAAEELVRRGVLEVADLRPLLSDPSLAVRQVALKALLALGDASITPEIARERLSTKTASSSPWSSGERVDVESVVAAAYEKRSDAELRESRSWYRLDGSIAYAFLAQRLGAAGIAQVRSDLDDDFSAIKRQSREEMQLKYGEMTDSFLSGFDRFESFTESQYRSAALSFLEAHGDATDIKYARHELERGGTPLELTGLQSAIRLAKLYGNASDAPLLLDTAQKHYGRVQRIAAEVAVGLDPSTAGALGKLLSSSDVDLVRVGFCAVWKNAVEDVLLTAESLLRSETVDIRRVAIAYLVEHRSRQALERLLDEYAAGGLYYYNVICWLDRALYAPVPLRERFVESLRSFVLTPPRSLYDQ